MLPVRWQGQAPPSIGGTWCYICLLIDLYNREIVGHAAGACKDSNLVKAAFATVAFPLFDIDVFHSGRGSEFDNAVDESASKTLKAEFVHREQFGSLHDLQVKLNDYAWWYNNERMHSTLGYMSPIEFRKAGLSL